MSESPAGPRLLEGRKALVLGVVNELSIGWGIAANLASHGATVGFGFQPNPKIERRCRACVEQLEPEPEFVEPCDVGKDEDIERLMARWKDMYGRLDILVHSIAYAPSTAFGVPFSRTPRRDFLEALDISAYSLVALCREAAPLMKPDGSVIAMTYHGALAYFPNYNVMAVAKAALECCVRYLAAELGGGQTEDAARIRVNAISAGPIPTMASKAVGNVDRMVEHWSAKSCLGRTVDQAEVGRTAVYLASNLSSGVTGEVLYVDAGYRFVGW
ncbi:MAG: enoyl-ACP reductase [Candidatus Riflebacteria bacterium]|nr:enoyl-ACP reductase [Candidatus Riflebacteria bacterium]